MADGSVDGLVSPATNLDLSLGSGWHWVWGAARGIVAGRPAQRQVHVVLGVGSRVGIITGFPENSELDISA